MDIARTLSDGGQSRAKTQVLADYIGSDPQRFAQLMSIFDRGDGRTKQCAAWPISVVAEEHPELLLPYLPKLLPYLRRNDVHGAVKRNIVRLLQFVSVPDRLRAKVFSDCLELIADPAEPVAVRCFAMTAALRAAENELSLVKELRAVCENQSSHATAGMKVRIRRIVSGK